MSEREKTVQGLLNAAVEDETLRGWRLMGEAADTIERLISERDEAYARGYRKGVEDAAGAARRSVVTADQKFESVFAKAQAGVKDLSLAGACAFGMLHMAESVQAAILAILEQTKPGEKK